MSDAPTGSYRLQRQRSGALSVHNAAYGETMHPGAGPWAEANRLYVEGSGLADLLSRPGRGPVVVFDVGLGAAANALAAVGCHEALVRRGGRPRELHLVSFEADPQGARFALAEAAALQYPRGREAALAELLDTGTAEPAPGVRWELRVGDFPALLAQEAARPQVVFFDPFSPKANPEMWRLSTLEALYRCRPRAENLRLLTYSTAFGTRAGLLLAGFFVGEGPRPNEARPSTLAVTWPDDLARPLTPGWLARWRKDREPWPPRTVPAEHRELRRRLLEHPQWARFGAKPGDDAPEAPATRRGATGGDRPTRGGGAGSGPAKGVPRGAGAGGKPGARPRRGPGVSSEGRGRGASADGRARTGSAERPQAPGRRSPPRGAGPAARPGGHARRKKR